MKSDKKYALMTNDVETTSIWFNKLRDETGEKVFREGMPQLLDLYAKYGIKSTFYFTAYIARLYPEIVRMALQDGHEIGSHGKSHIKENGFDIMPFARQKEHLHYSKSLLEDISGKEVLSFRAPALRVSPITARALIETGFKYDSSVASQRFDFFMSFGSKQKLSFLTAPRLPYRTKANNIFSKGNSDLVEVPLSATLLPYAGTTMRMFPNMTKMQQRFLDFESKLNGKPVVFVIHPNEFIDESDEARIIEKRSSNPVEFVLKDLLRAKLKARNLGGKALPIYEELIKFYNKNGYTLTTVKNYVEASAI
jgi:peptidoglycan/xylan/chitin deacetylase (PgdA/CDA1 family)